MSMSTEKGVRMFVTGAFQTIAPAASVIKTGLTPARPTGTPGKVSNTVTPQPARQPMHQPSAINHRRPTDTDLLRELASKTATDAVFAVNVNNLQDAQKRLSDALGYVQRLMQASGMPVVNAGEFEGYDSNNPNAPLNPQLSAPGRYSMNASNIIKPVDEFAGYDINAL